MWESPRLGDLLSSRCACGSSETAWIFPGSFPGRPWSRICAHVGHQKLSGFFRLIFLAVLGPEFHAHVGRRSLEGFFPPSSRHVLSAFRPTITLLIRVHICSRKLPVFLQAIFLVDLRSQFANHGLAISISSVFARRAAHFQTRPPLPNSPVPLACSTSSEQGIMVPHVRHHCAGEPMTELRHLRCDRCDGSQ
jgi:hypothetical protein